MSVSLDVRAVEKSTYVVEVSFYDEDGAAVVPASDIVWTLTDSTGNAITGANGTVSPAASVDIVLSGSDLAITEAASAVTRIITIETTYDSSLGNGLPLRGAASFVVENLAAVT